MDSDFPKPETAALDHSALLTDNIRQIIEDAGGWISFADYMERALYTPGLGYYSAGATKFGPAGDFVTAPEISPLFAQTLAGQLAAALESMAGGTVLELGAGRGRMAVDLLLELERLGSLPAEYLILETSGDLRSRQREHFEGIAPHLLARVRWLDRGPAEPFLGIIVANEVLDALPVNRFIVDETRAERISELGVTWVDDELANASRPATGELLKSLLPVMELEGFEPANGYTSEINLRMPAWIAGVASWLSSGLCLFIDYGYSRAEYYRTERRTGTLRCFYQHRAHDEALLWPGLQDISAWVDFTLVAESAVASGLEVAGYTTQAQCLMASGIMERFAAVQAQTSAHAAMASQGLQRLLMPAEMGETVKVMTLAKGAVKPPTGLLGRDMRRTL
jgi:SAM-dependent MidA family methyltransferase